MKIPKQEYTAEFKEQAVKRVKAGQVCDISVYVPHDYNGTAVRNFKKLEFS
jgi:hypothetical protein